MSKIRNEAFILPDFALLLLSAHDDGIKEVQQSRKNDQNHDHRQNGTYAQVMPDPSRTPCVDTAPGAGISWEASVSRGSGSV